MAATIDKEDLKDEAALQLDANGKLRHLLTLKGVDKALLIDILDDAEQYLTTQCSPPARSQALAGRTIAKLFFEPSTCTRASFDLAGKRLGADVLNLDGIPGIDEYFANYGISQKRIEIERVSRTMAAR